MRVTVDLADEVLDELSKMTGENKKSPAIARAVAEYIRRQKAKEFAHLLREGAFDYPTTNEEIERTQG